LILAPAGYGKSTLVSAWLEADRRRSVWLSLDDHDSDLPTFLSYLVAAIRSIEPGACQRTIDLLNAPEVPPLHSIASVLINEIDAIEDPFILILDNYQDIRAMAVHDLLTELLRHPPRALHLVLISRLSPPLDLIRLRARGQVVEVRMEDLRFDAMETGAFVQRATGFLVEETDAALLEERCEGWITALRLATLSMGSRADFDRVLAGLQGDSVRVRDYLTAEVLARLPQAVQEFLVKTSFLDRLSGSLCDEVMELDEPECHGQAHLEWLHRVNLFTIPLDDKGHWYRYHHLFRDLLRSRLAREVDAESIAQLHARASRWFARNGLIDEALRHALAAGDIHAGARLVEQNGPALLNDDKWYTLEKWLAQLPDDVILERPRLLLTKAWVLFYHFALWAIPPLLDTVEAILKEDEDSQPLWGEVAFLWGHHWFWQGQNARSLDLFRRALERIPKTSYMARGHTELFWAVASQMSGQKREAVQALNQWLRPQQTLHPVRQARLEGSLMFISLLSGDLAEAGRMARQFYAAAVRNNNAYARAWGSYLQACVCYFWNDLEGAAQHFEQAVETRYNLHTRAAVDSLAGLTLTYQALGQPDEARAMMARLLEFAQDTLDPAYVAVSRSCQARLALLQGDMASAARWLQTADLTSDTNVMFYWVELSQVTQCRVLIAQGTEASLQKALELLEEYELQNEAQHNTRQLIDILLLQALTRHKLGQAKKTLALLERAVKLAEPDGWIRPFVEPGPDMASLLNWLGQQDVAPHFIAQILAAFPMPQISHPAQPAVSPAQLPEPLTDRELEVLGLLAQRYSNKEIAAELVISTTTVKRHASNIYQKLHVGSRRQAVARATALGILPAAR
jgi:LuxR family maltose regulon positive regulatory protein